MEKTDVEGMKATKAMEAKPKAMVTVVAGVTVRGRGPVAEATDGGRGRGKSGPATAGVMPERGTKSHCCLCLLHPAPHHLPLLTESGTLLLVSLLQTEKICKYDYFDVFLKRKATLHPLCSTLRFLI